MSQALCNECGGLLVLSESGEYVCEGCGLVHVEAKINSLAKTQNKGISCAKYFEVLNRTPFKSSISWHGVDVKRSIDEIKVLERFKKLDFLQRYYIDKLSVKAVRKAYAVLLSLCSLIPTQFSSIIRRRALEIYYNTAIRMRHVRKNHVALVAASFYVATKERCKGYNLTLKQIMSHLRKIGFSISLSDIFKALFMLRKAVGVIVRHRKVEELLSIAIRRVMMDERVRRRLSKNSIDPLLYSRELYVEAASLLNKKTNCSKSPQSLIAAAIYTADKILALKHQWKDVLTQKSLSSILEVSSFTIRELYYKIFRKYLFGDHYEK
ncbi:MAG: hypothetical protein QXP29_01515 [Candidatus Nezhaarchaeales archaeon]